MTVIEGKNGLFLIHYPQIEAVVTVGTGHIKVIIHNVDSIRGVLSIVVDELGVLVNLPKDHFTV